MSKRVSLKIPEIGLIAVTRVALGAGIGFLLAGKLDRHDRKTVGWLLFSIGAATTVPIVLDVIRKSTESVDELAA